MNIYLLIVTCCNWMLIIVYLFTTGFHQKFMSASNLVKKPWNLWRTFRIIKYYFRRPGPPRSRRARLPHHPPVHRALPARRLPRAEARVLQARVADVRQAEEARSGAPHPHPARRPRQDLHPRILLQPRAHGNLRHLQAQDHELLVVPGS